MKRKWNSKWPEIYKNPAKHDELIKYEDTKNLILREILRKAEFKDKVVLDVGAGTGKYAILLSKIVKKIYGLEIEKRQIGYLKKKLRKLKIRNVIPALGNAEKMPFPDKQDNTP